MHQAGLDHNHLRGERQGVECCIRSRLGLKAQALPSDGLEELQGGPSHLRRGNGILHVRQILEALSYPYCGFGGLS